MKFPLTPILACAVIASRRYDYDAPRLADRFPIGRSVRESTDWPAVFTVNSAFESGNGEIVSLDSSVNPAELRVRVRPDRLSVVDKRVWGLWFYFGVNGREGKPTKFIVENDGLAVYDLGSRGRAYDTATYEQCMIRRVSWEGAEIGAAGDECYAEALAAVKCPAVGDHLIGYRVRYSYDRTNWYPLASTEVDASAKEIRFTMTPVHNLVYFALMQPHTPENVLDYVSELQTRSGVESVEMIGESGYNLPIWLVQIGSASASVTGPKIIDLASDNPPELDSLKPAVWAIARQHPGEVIGGYAAEGIAEFLTNPPAGEAHVAAALLDAFVFYIVPLINPDGANLGNWRTNGMGHNQNRDWSNAQIDTTPEIFYLQGAMDRKGVSFMMDLHMAAADKHVTVYWPNGVDVVDTAKAQADLGIELPTTQPDLPTEEFTTVESRRLSTACAEEEGQFFGLADWWVQDALQDQKSNNSLFGSNCQSRPLGLKWLLSWTQEPTSTSDLLLNKLAYNRLRKTFDDAAKAGSEGLWTAYDTVGTGSSMYRGLTPGYHPYYGDMWPQYRYGAIGITVEMPGVYSCEAYMSGGMQEEDSVFGAKHGRLVGRSLMLGLNAVKYEVKRFEGVQFETNFVSYTARAVAAKNAKQAKDAKDAEEIKKVKAPPFFDDAGRPDRRLNAARDRQFHNDAIYRQFINQRLGSSLSYASDSADDAKVHIAGISPVWSRHATCQTDGARCEIRADADVADPHNVKVYLKPDAFSNFDDAVFAQNFYVVVDGLTPGRSARFEVANIKAASWADGFESGARQPIWFSHDRERWWSITNQIEGESLTVYYTPTAPLMHIAYQPVYNFERHLDDLGLAQTAYGGKVEQIGLSVENRPIHMVTLGTPAAEKKRIWVIGRTHPGESQSSHLITSMLRNLKSNSECSHRLLNEAVFHFIPALNVDGLANGSHRTNARGHNLNRVWDFPSLDSSPEVYFALEAMKREGVSMMLDIHQDENIDEAFGVFYKQGNLYGDAVSAELEATYDAFNVAFREASGGVYTGENLYGFPTSPDLPYYSDSSTVYRFKDAFGFTLEMPFRRSESSGGAVWSPDDSADLAVAMTEAICAVVDRLPVNNGPDREIGYNFLIDGRPAGLTETDKPSNRAVTGPVTGVVGLAVAALFA